MKPGDRVRVREQWAFETMAKQLTLVERQDCEEVEAWMAARDDGELFYIAAHALEVIESNPILDNGVINGIGVNETVPVAAIDVRGKDRHIQYLPKRNMTAFQLQRILPMLIMTLVSTSEDSNDVAERFIMEYDLLPEECKRHFKEVKDERETVGVDGGG